MVVRSLNPQKETHIIIEGGHRGAYITSPFLPNEQNEKSTHLLVSRSVFRNWLINQVSLAGFSTRPDRVSYGFLQGSGFQVECLGRFWFGLFNTFRSGCWHFWFVTLSSWFSFFHIGIWSLISDACSCDSLFGHWNALYKTSRYYFALER